MDQINTAAELANHETADNNGREPTPRAVAELRTLKDLELLLVGGGDGIPNWPK